jgi:hypothetical protein
MKAFCYIWWRAFSIVTCTALNVSQVAGGHYHAAFFTGGVLSWIWWQNTKTAVKTDHTYGQAAYALGAACGTIFGMFLGGAIRTWTT